MPENKKPSRAVGSVAKKARRSICTRKSQRLQKRERCTTKVCACDGQDRSMWQNPILCKQKDRSDEVSDGKNSLKYGNKDSIRGSCMPAKGAIAAAMINRTTMTLTAIRRCAAEAGVVAIAAGRSRSGRRLSRALLPPFRIATPDIQLHGKAEMRSKPTRHCLPGEG